MYTIQIINQYFLFHLQSEHTGEGAVPPTASPRNAQAQSYRERPVCRRPEASFREVPRADEGGAAGGGREDNGAGGRELQTQAHSGIGYY